MLDAVADVGHDFGDGEQAGTGSLDVAVSSWIFMQSSRWMAMLSTCDSRRANSRAVARSKSTPAPWS